MAEDYEFKNPILRELTQRIEKLHSVDSYSNELRIEEIIRQLDDLIITKLEKVKIKH